MAHKKKNLIIFDDTQPLEIQKKFLINGTVELKATFIKNVQLGGVLVHHIDMDDYTGQWCQRGKYPITSTVSRIFSATIPPIAKTVPNVKQSGMCENIRTKDLLEDPNDCRSYFVCLPISNQPVAHLQCPNNMFFSSKQKACTRDHSVSMIL